MNFLATRTNRTKMGGYTYVIAGYGIRFDIPKEWEESFDLTSEQLKDLIEELEIDDFTASEITDHPARWTLTELVDDLGLSKDTIADHLGDILYDNSDVIIEKLNELEKELKPSGLEMWWDYTEREFNVFIGLKSRCRNISSRFEYCDVSPLTPDELSVFQRFDQEPKFGVYSSYEE